MLLTFLCDKSFLWSSSILVSRMQYHNALNFVLRSDEERNFIVRESYPTETMPLIPKEFIAFLQKYNCVARFTQI